MNLIRQGKFLDDDKTLADHSVADGEFLVATNMVPRHLPPVEPVESGGWVRAPPAEADLVGQPVQSQAEMPSAVEMARE